MSNVIQPIQNAANRLRTERMAQGLSLRELAYFSGCAHTTLARMENGTLDGSAQLKARIARALCVPVNELWPLGMDAAEFPGKEPAS